MLAVQRGFTRSALSVAAALLLLAAVKLAEPAATLAQEPALGPEKEPASTPPESVAEIIFPAPKPYAIVYDSSRQVQRLYTKGDVFFHPHNPRQPVKVLEVDAGGVVIQLNRQGEERYVTAGPLLPDSPDVTLLRVVGLERLQYRFNLVDPVTDPEPVVVSLGRSRAVLEKQVSRLPAHTVAGREENQRQFTTGLFQKVKVTQVDEHIYEVQKESVQPIIEDMAEVLSRVRIEPDPSYFGLTSNLNLSLRSPFGEGVLHSGGFTVKEMSIAETFGLQVGDIIVSLNGRPVNSPLSAYMVFQELFIRNRDLRELRVVLLRDAALIAQGYRIR